MAYIRTVTSRVEKSARDLYCKSFRVVNYNCNVRSYVSKVRSSLQDHSFTVLATVITIIN